LYHFHHAQVLYEPKIPINRLRIMDHMAFDNVKFFNVTPDENGDFTVKTPVVLNHSLEHLSHYIWLGDMDVNENKFQGAGLELLGEHLNVLYDQYANLIKRLAHVPDNTHGSFSFKREMLARADPVWGMLTKVSQTEMLAEAAVIMANGPAATPVSEFQTDANGLLTQDQATAFVNTLEAVDVSTIDASDKCPHCWGTWDEETDNNNSPVRLPCADGQHILGFDCLVEILTAVGPLCPLCRVNILSLST
jgi:hypothetical protein